MVSSHLWGLKTNESACSIPSRIQRRSGRIAAEPAYEASTWSQVACRAQISPMGPSGSTAVDDVVPTVATTQAGRTPAARSASIAAASASGRIAKAPSTGMVRSISRPMPESLTPLGTDECASADAYTASGPVPARPADPDRNPVARSRAERSATSVAVEEVSCMTPVNASGSPSRARSHSITTCSSSVAAGDVCQDMHCAPSVAASISASTLGGLLFAGK